MGTSHGATSDAYLERRRIRSSEVTRPIARASQSVDTNGGENAYGYSRHGF